MKRYNRVNSNLREYTELDGAQMYIKRETWWSRSCLIGIWMICSWSSRFVVVFFIRGEYDYLNGGDCFVLCLLKFFFHLALYFFKPEEFIFLVIVGGDAELAFFQFLRWS